MASDKSQENVQMQRIIDRLLILLKQCSSFGSVKKKINVRIHVKHHKDEPSSEVMIYQ